MYCEIDCAVARFLKNVSSNKMPQQLEATCQEDDMPPIPADEQGGSDADEQNISDDDFVSVRKKRKECQQVKKCNKSTNKRRKVTKKDGKVKHKEQVISHVTPT